MGDHDLVFAKGIYPYSYMISPENFKERQLPNIDAFYNDLKDEPLSNEDYQRAQETWTHFGIKTMRDYNDHYLKSDVLLLSDVFQHFRQSVFDKHRLDCLHFYTLPDQFRRDLKTHLFV